ncbi:TraR/DksA C4-type zinc finger protein [Vibrio amylolyticus]|uniref:TraR/DksA C4-type zinc finger protein n=1 Tax=Vibrio amylolyticus TaxID=2847292 RepID=UPI00354D28CE
MPDLFDHASQLETKFTEIAIANQLNRTAPTRLTEGTNECIECGDEIPKARQVAIVGCLYCMPCQEERE